MARSLPVDNLLPQNVGSIVNYLQYSTEVAKWRTPSCSQPQPARTISSQTVDPIDWSHPPPSWAVLPEHLVHRINRCSSAGIRSCNLQHERQPPCLCGHWGPLYKDDPISLCCTCGTCGQRSHQALISSAFVQGRWDQCPWFPGCSSGLWFQERSLLLFFVHFLVYQCLI